MGEPLSLIQTSIFKKALVALTGAVLFGFVIVHMLGNLQVFSGPEALNDYSRALRKVPELLWTARAILIVSVVIHIGASVSLVKRSVAARPLSYRVKRNLATSYAARTMRWSGPLILVFVLFHLAHLTWPGIAMGRYDAAPDDVYANVVNGFRVPWVTALYVGRRCCWGCTSIMAPGACFSRWGSAIRATPASGGGRRAASPPPWSSETSPCRWPFSWG